MIEIKTKYEPGDKVWAMVENEPCLVSVEKICIIIRFNLVNDIVADMVYVCDRGKKFDEEQLCDTKAELKQRVFDELKKKFAKQMNK